jgi:hypothetical protein
VVCLKRLGLAAGAVQREHQLRAEALAKRVLVDEAFELRDELAAETLLEVGVHASLQHVQAALVEAPDLRLGERLEAELGEGRAAPEGERLPKERRAAVRALEGCGRRELLEAAGVRRVGGDPEHVTGLPRGEHVRRQQLADLRDEVLERRRRGARRRLAPELVHEAVDRDDLVRVDQEEGEEGALLLPAERDRPAVADDLERTEDPEIEHGGGRHRPNPYRGRRRRRIRERSRSRAENYGRDGRDSEAQYSTSSSSSSTP